MRTLRLITAPAPAPARGGGRKWGPDGVGVGVYQVPGGDTYVVKLTRAVAGKPPPHPYAQRVRVLTAGQGDRANSKDEAEAVRFKLEFEWGLIWKLRPEYRLEGVALEAFITQFRRCIMCGQGLVQKVSLDRAMGKVCYENVTGNKVSR
jgi:hypothetical protein